MFSRVRGQRMNGVEMYCCEQPDGSMECRTMTPSHEECEIFDENGDVKVDCSPNLSVEQRSKSSAITNIITHLFKNNKIYVYNSKKVYPL